MDSDSQKHYLSTQELALVLRIRKRTVERLVRFELITPVTTAPELRFRPEEIPRLRRLVRLQLELGVSWTAMGVVLALMDRVKQLERERNRFSQTGGEPAEAKEPHGDE